MRGMIFSTQFLFFFFFLLFFLVWTIFKVFIEFVAILLPFYVLVFGPKACGILAPGSGIKPPAPVLEDEVSTTRPPGRSPILVSKIFELLIYIFSSLTYIF